MGINRIGNDHDEYEDLRKIIDEIENIAFYILVVIWTMYFLYAAFYKPKHRTPWADVLAGRSQNNFVRAKTSQDIGFFEPEGDPEELEEDATSPEATLKPERSPSVQKWTLQSDRSETS